MFCYDNISLSEPHYQNNIFNETPHKYFTYSARYC
jgi:hypothetical protein